MAEHELVFLTGLGPLDFGIPVAIALVNERMSGLGPVIEISRHPDLIGMRRPDTEENAALAGQCAHAGMMFPASMGRIAHSVVLSTGCDEKTRQNSRDLARCPGHKRS